MLSVNSSRRARSVSVRRRGRARCLVDILAVVAKERGGEAERSVVLVVVGEKWLMGQRAAQVGYCRWGCVVCSVVRLRAFVSELRVSLD